ncbi:MAG TPA: VWA domain-containing protein [bacterium]|nr:VWA domain-containing protein [bacterium]
MRFGAPHYLLIVFLWLPALLVYLAVARRRRERFAGLFSTGHRDLLIAVSPNALWTRRLFLWMALVLLTFAAARPQMGEAEIHLSGQGADMAVAFDVSLSMLAEDEDGPRFEKGARLLADAIAELGGDRVAIVPFAGSAFLQLPLTADHNTALAVTSALRPGMIERPGSAIGAAVSLAIETLKSGPEESDKLLVIVSDGEDPALDFEQVRRELDEAKVSLAYLPLGTIEGAPIRIGENYLKDGRGETVVSKLNREFFDKCRDGLGAMEITRGETLASFLRSFRNRTGTDEKRVQLYREQFPVPLALGLLFFALFIVLPVGRKEEKR